MVVRSGTCPSLMVALGTDSRTRGCAGDRVRMNVLGSRVRIAQSNILSGFIVGHRRSFRNSRARLSYSRRCE